LLAPLAEVCETAAMSDLGSPSAQRNFYGRRHGKTLRPNQRTYLHEDLAPLSPGAVSHADNPRRLPLDMAPFAGRDLWLEVGFGGGEHMVAQAAGHPEAVLIGCEPFINGVAMLLGKVREAGIGNLRVYPGDARDLIELLPPASVARAFLLYPDPWPKRRHHRRRFVTPGYLGPLARVLRPGAEFRVATDIADYVRQALEEVPPAGFALVEEGAVAWPDWTPTRYERKALREGRAPRYLTFRRL
jgi:tRNA (guanine-N7-)-methyltransferase